MEGGLCQKCFDNLNVESPILDNWKKVWEIEKQIAEQNRIIVYFGKKITSFLDKLWKFG